ncbi:3'(2'),5'-bisphosphate nucleotidase CysQ family protein [Campylobacter geochelonis]|uniref:3'(2'),5'-bisphosphate nucleotidase CysQ n=1 Tax=Campylobacter geochelonis TaxID=1780362 RepID=A0A128EMI0_9BACT|nr:3'(2'),5'-bisphosphate nucleotidase CysQ [Campylobacter geochelonis]QKF72103.1 adenosine-3'(2'),5'-bisphosphate nucleotidase [Campylobacter geochelonis]CZE45904.1 protein CysQ [Campylobacter geochelonis]CZE46724.1 protein CysQ [Campylobacter geochelonis]CZE49810.1 protein CysQ [Campylobacter geochelonis]
MKELLSLAVRAAKCAGEAILKHYQNYTLFQKSDKSPLTTADLAANDEIFKILSQTNIPICSEESILDDDLRLNLDKFWLVDPLDGTKEFIAQNGEFCVCIALIERGRPILGVIYIPIKDEIFYSCIGEKLYKNDEILKPLDKSPNLFLLGKHGNSKKGLSLANSLNLEPFRIGSAIKFCILSQNKASVYARFGASSIWDIAAGEFLLTQSGGVLIDLKTKKPPLYNQKNLINNPFIALDSNSLNLLNQSFEIIEKFATTK